MSDDETYADRLRARADLVAPRFDIDAERVVRRARARRGLVRGGAVTAAAVTVVVAGAWAAPSVGWDPFAAPPAAQVEDEPTPDVPADDPTTPQPQPSAPVEPTYWYERTETTDDAGTEVSETWSSRELPGLLVTDSDLTNPGAFGPRDVLGSFHIDGVWIEQLRDPAALPTDAAALDTVLHDSLQPDRGQGTDDQKVVDKVRDLLTDGGLLPVALRLALWDVAAGLPGATDTTGEDSTGRAGRVVSYAAHGGEVRWVGDPVTGLLLETSEPDVLTVYVEQHGTNEIPVEPTIQMAGCATWETC